MAKLYNKKTHDIYWTDSDIVCLVEEAYWELSDFIAVKRLDGHDRIDQWYMNVHRKLDELLDVLVKNPIDELAEGIEPLN